MKYKKLGNEKKVSMLGYGCMRFTSKALVVDEKKAINELYHAYQNNINYFDTAYIYHGGKSEVILGKFIKKYNIRDNVFIADKMPVYLVSSEEKLDIFLNKQLSRLDTNYIDFYLLHSLTSYNDLLRLKKMNIYKFLEDKKKEGIIKNIGFSFHGSYEDYLKILNDYRWDFCQIQYNYLDTNFQAGTKGLKAASKLGIDVIVMEPLRGGSLVNNVPPNLIEIFKSHNKDKSLVDYALSFILNHDEVNVILSGMNDVKQINENIGIVDNFIKLNNNDLLVYEKFSKEYQKLLKVSCTKCKYCMPCPFGVNIPEIFSYYNNLNFFKNKQSKFQTHMQYINKLFDGSGASMCTHCGKCKKNCPQNIDIPVKLKEAHKSLNNKFVYILLKISNKFIKKEGKKK